MSPETFRHLLANLLLAAAESGLDVFYLHSELMRAGSRLVEDCRCDLIEADDAEDATC
jgi:hypothetical protein